MHRDVWAYGHNTILTRVAIALTFVARMHLATHMIVLLVMIEMVLVMLVPKVESVRELGGKGGFIWPVHLAVLLFPAGDVLRFIAALGRAVVVAFHRLSSFIIYRRPFIWRAWE